VSELSFHATPDLPGIGGTLKAAPEDFCVEELPAYLPSGAGEHVYLRIRRAQRNTRDLQNELARLFGLRPANVGLAGLKDKQALSTQWFSLHLHALDPQVCAARVRDELGVEVLEASRHANKLRLGHLRGNRFTIRLRDVHAEALPRAQAIAARLQQHGLANAFGEQRFGRDGDNALRGRELFEKPARGWLAELKLSAWQSQLFHEWLEQRHACGALPALLEGDIAERSDGPQFEVEDPARERLRVQAGEIVPTGPLYGYRMRECTGPSAALEAALLASHGITTDDLARVQLPGARRAAWLRVAECEITALDGAAPASDLGIAFALPPGSYATVVLREFRKPPPPSAPTPAAP
jgi:tRNA pseudouridine13 synthase